MLLVQQKSDEYIKQLASTVDVLTTHNMMLEAEITQQAISSSTPPGRLPSKPERNPYAQCNYVTSKEGYQILRVWSLRRVERRLEWIAR